MAVAKGIAGGFPMGVVLATGAAAAGMTAGSHGSTFGGNQLASAVACAVLEEILSDGFLEGVQRVGDYFRARLEDLVRRHGELFQSVRGVGLMLGIKCVASNLDIVARLREEGLLTVPADDNFLRFLPPLIVDESHVDEAMAILDRVAEAWDKGDG
jgi:acetylornithine/N-succinyldiaminopimelate aminotransferase